MKTAVKAARFKLFVSRSASPNAADKRLMCPRKEEEEVKDDGTEGGREGRKDEGGSLMLCSSGERRAQRGFTGDQRRVQQGVFVLDVTV